MLALGVGLGAGLCDAGGWVYVFFGLIALGAVATGEAASAAFPTPVLARVVLATITAAAVGATAGWAMVIVNFGHCPFTLFRATSIAV